MTAIVASMYKREMTVEAKMDLRNQRVAVLPFSSSSYKKIASFECKEGVVLAEAVERRLREKVKEVQIVSVHPAREYYQSAVQGREDYRELAGILDCDVIIHGEILRIENRMGLDKIETLMEVWAYDARDDTRPVNEEIQARYPEIGTYSVEEMDDQERLVKNVMKGCGRAAALLFFKHKTKKPLGTRELVLPESK